MDVPAATPLTADRPPTDRAELGALARLAGPLVAANLLQMAIAAVDVIFVARVGKAELAAATIGVFLFHLMLYGLIGLTSAASALIAAELGRRKHAVREVRRSFRMALWAAILLALPVMLQLWRGEYWFLLAQQNPEVARQAGDFLKILVIAFIPGVVAGVMRSTAAALGRPGWALVVTALALGVGILVNWLLVFGNAGFPTLGLKGSALATVAGTTTMLLAYLVIFLTDRKLRRYRLFGRWWRFEWRRFFDILFIGAPIMLAWVMEGALFGGAALLMGKLGVTEIAAHAIALNIAAVAFQVPFGIAQAATIRVGMGFGAGDRAWIARAGRVALATGIGFMGLTALAMWLVPKLLISAYLDIDLPLNADVVALAVQFLAIGALFQLVDGAQAVAAGVLRGLQDTVIPMLVAGFGYWVIGFGLAFYLGFSTPLRGVGIWLGLFAGLFVVSGLLLWRWAARGRIGLLPEPPVAGTDAAL